MGHMEYRNNWQLGKGVSKIEKYQTQAGVPPGHKICKRSFTPLAKAHVCYNVIVFDSDGFKLAVDLQPGYYKGDDGVLEYVASMSVVNEKLTACQMAELGCEQIPVNYSMPAFECQRPSGEQGN